MQWSANRVYEKHCALKEGQTYTLKCEATSEQGWKSNYLVIENSAYCKYTDSETQIDITISG